MRKSVIAVVAALVGAALLVPASAPAVQLREPESCFAVNPGQPKCSFTATSESSSGTVTGAVGAPGDWVVVIKRGKKKLTLKGPGTPEPTGFEIIEGDKVTATQSGPGWVLVGHD